MTVQITRLLRWISDEEPEVTLLCGSADRAYPRSSTPIQLPGCIADSSYVLVPEMLASGAEKVLIDVESCSCDDFDERVAEGKVPPRRISRLLGVHCLRNGLIPGGGC